MARRINKAKLAVSVNLNRQGKVVSKVLFGRNIYSSAIWARMPSSRCENPRSEAIAYTRIRISDSRHVSNHSDIGSTGRCRPIEAMSRVIPSGEPEKEPCYQAVQVMQLEARGWS